MRLDALLQVSRMHRITVLWMAVVVLMLTLGLPLLGVVLSGETATEYLRFPPSIAPADHPAVSWPLFTFVGVVDLILFGALFGLIISAIKRGGKEVSTSVQHTGQFPKWGWPIGILFIGSWTIAWTRFDFVGALQEHTFFPLWLFFILLINAFCEWRRGWAPVTSRPGWFLLLFPVSGLFWWVFEFLNAFTRNWYYTGVDPSQPVDYFVSATLPFSTVLPAVLSICALLLSFDRLDDGVKHGHRLCIPKPKAVASGFVVAACLALLFLGILPEFLFPALWLSPLVLLASLQSLAGYENIFTPLKRGDWRSFLIPAAAGIICGVCWELWNMGSLAHWTYSIPFVERFHVFAMPIEGYAGYLPFGLECMVIAQLVYRLLHPPSEHA